MNDMTGFCTDTPTDEPDLTLPFERERKRHMAMALSFITNNLSHKFTDMMDIVKARSWFQLLINHDDYAQTKWNCFYCANYADEFRIKHKTALAGPEGVMWSKERNHVELRDHANSASHKNVMEKFQLKYAGVLENTLQTELRRGESPEFYVTNNHLRSAFWLAKEGVPIIKYPSFIDLQSFHGAKMGDFCRSDTIAKEMIRSISTVLFEDMKRDLLLSDAPMTILAGLLFYQFYKSIMVRLLV